MYSCSDKIVNKPFTHDREIVNFSFCHNVSTKFNIYTFVYGQEFTIGILGVNTLILYVVSIKYRFRKKIKTFIYTFIPYTSFCKKRMNLKCIGTEKKSLKTPYLRF